MNFDFLNWANTAPSEVGPTIPGAALTLPSSLVPLRDSGDRETEYKAIKVRYGGGYMHARPEGVAPVHRSIPIRFVLDTARRAVLLSFLGQVGTWAPFNATLPGYEPRPYRVKGQVRESMLGGDLWQISLELMSANGEGS